MEQSGSEKGSDLKDAADGPKAKKEKLDVLVAKCGNTESPKVVLKRLDRVDKTEKQVKNFLFLQPTTIKGEFLSRFFLG